VNSGARISAGPAPELNRIPRSLKHIHMMGICGVGMASLAGLLKNKGFLITGSDQNVYPPMSHYLRDLSISVKSGYRVENLIPRPDLVIVGNVITRSNPEALELCKSGIPYLSMPQALREFALKGRKSLLVCGTHGKTTTSGLAAWVLEQAGTDPGFMVGGIPHNFGRNFKEGRGDYYVVEGDEYDTAFFDKGPKFLHYEPWGTILTSIEYDHADIYKDVGQVIESFRKLMAILPPDGFLIVNGDDPVALDESRRAQCPAVSYGFGDGVDWRAGKIINGEPFTRIEVVGKTGESFEIRTQLYGRHNVSNLLAAFALAEMLGLERALVLDGMRTFKGIKRRQEVIGEKRGILVLDDFAHHPTAVEETIGAVKERYERRRLVAVFEPRSNSSRRSVFQAEYASCFDRADAVFIPEPPLMETIPPDERFSSRRLVEDLTDRGLNALYCPDTDHLLGELLQEVKEGDVILIMSNGSFDNLPQRLMKNLES